MSIQWVEKGKKRTLAIALAALAFAAQIAAGLWQGSPLWAHLPGWTNLPLAAGLAGFIFLAFGTKIEVNRWWGAVIELCCVAGASFILLHLPLLHWMGMRPTGVIRGVSFAFVLVGAAFVLTANIKWFGAFWLTACFVFNIIECEIIEFSGNVITMNDILAIGTAINVANNYSFIAKPLMITNLIFFIGCMRAMIGARELRPSLKKLWVRALVVPLVAAAAYPAWYTYRHNKPTTFWSNGIRRNSIAVEFLLESKTLKVSQPKGYSAEAIAALGAEYPGRAATAAAEKQPHVIAIMIEAFSDLSVLGRLETNVDYMPFTRELMKQSVSGHALVSTKGGGTARSEWEFLTGNSMAFMPGGSMPFRQFMGSDENSLVRVFENAGYHTIGMHPYLPNGWARDRIYPALGFDDIYFVGDLEWDEYVRRFVSDRAFVHQVIRLYEDRDPGQPLFFFGVTMQDHGNYAYEDFQPTVTVNGHEGEFPNAEQYLSLIRETDDAIRELIEYFSGVDEPVQIVFFGDHQPVVEEEFYSYTGVETTGQKYLVPFVMWDNYEHRVEDVGMTSLNFLPARLLDLTGIQKPAYFCFLSEVNRAVTAMNHFGCVLGEESFRYGRLTDEKAREMLLKYQAYQYANMFDKTVDRKLFIGPVAKNEE